MNSATIPTELLPGTELKRSYRIVRTLGEGGMGRVYEAENAAGQRCALKQTLFTNPDKRVGLKAEALLLAALDHAHLPKVYEVFEDGSNCYLAMQYVPGPTLKDITSKIGPLPLQAVLLVADQLLLTLEYLHTRPSPIIHRDIKPDNIKVGDKTYLLDFGVAKYMATGTLVYAQSLGYSSPEQQEDEKTDERSDIYSLGATLYTLLTAIEPWDAKTRFRAISEGKPDPLQLVQEVNPQTPNLLAHVIHKAMALRPECRYANAREMRRALKGEEAEASSSSSRLETTDQTKVNQPGNKTDETLPPTPAIPQVSLARGASYALYGLITISLAVGLIWAFLSFRAPERSLVAQQPSSVPFEFPRRALIEQDLTTNRLKEFQPYSDIRNVEVTSGEGGKGHVAEINYVYSGFYGPDKVRITAFPLKNDEGPVNELYCEPAVINPGSDVAYVEFGRNRDPDMRVEPHHFKTTKMKVCMTLSDKKSDDAFFCKTIPYTIAW